MTRKFKACAKRIDIEDRLYSDELGILAMECGCRSFACGTYDPTFEHKHIEHGFTVAAMDRRLFADGLVVMTYVVGRPPETTTDWRRVADTLRQLHRLTQGWPAAPGMAIVDRTSARRDRDEDRPRRDAA